MMGPDLDPKESRQPREEVLVATLSTPERRSGRTRTCQTTPALKARPWVCHSQNPGAFPLPTGLVPPGRSLCFGEAVLRRVAVRAAQPIPSAALFEALPALPDFLFEPSPERRAERLAVSIWLPGSASQAAFHQA